MHTVDAIEADVAADRSGDIDRALETHRPGICNQRYIRRLEGIARRKIQVALPCRNRKLAGERAGRSGRERGEIE